MVHLDNIVEKYSELKRKIPGHELLKYFSFQNGRLVLSDNTDILVEFREKFGPSGSELNKFKSYEEYQRCLFK